jgi:hypothetical protein
LRRLSGHRFFGSRHSCTHPSQRRVEEHRCQNDDVTQHPGRDGWNQASAFDREPSDRGTERDAGLRERKEGAKDPSHQLRRRVLLDHDLEDGIDRASCEPAD